MGFPAPKKQANGSSSFHISPHQPGPHVCGPTASPQAGASGSFPPIASVGQVSAQNPHREVQAGFLPDGTFLPSP